MRLIDRQTNQLGSDFFVNVVMNYEREQEAAEREREREKRVGEKDRDTH